jgi:putative beta-lysine N-acetyltransferase
MNDRIETFGNSSIQHGKHSDRVYLMSLSTGDLPKILPYLDSLALTQGYTKIFAKVPAQAEEQFTANQYQTEADIPGFYGGEEGVFFMGKYFCSKRQIEKKPDLVEKALEVAGEKPTIEEAPVLEHPLVCRPTEPRDAEQMAELYRKVFASYPFPIHNPEYLVETMESHVFYYGLWDQEKLVALASAETDLRGQNAEMTDFATLPDYRSKGLASYLLAQLEEASAERGIQTTYTIARAYSYGMNITFAKQGYTFSGTLTHNTHISGELESMNVWHKTLS